MHQSSMNRSLRSSDVLEKKPSSFDDQTSLRGGGPLAMLGLDPSENDRNTGKEFTSKRNVRSFSRTDEQGEWTWRQYSDLVNPGPSQKRLLIGQYAPHDEEKALFDITKEVNEAYAQRWKHDIVFLTPASREDGEKSEYFSSMLVDALEEHSPYEQVLILDADVMMFDFAVDVTKLVPSQSVVAARKIYGNDPTKTSRVANGCTLWNLNHPMVAHIAQSWHMAVGLQEDQDALQRALLPHEEVVWSVAKEFNFDDDAVVKYFLWREEIRFDARVQRLTSSATKVCESFELECDLPKRTTSSHHRSDIRNNTLNVARGGGKNTSMKSNLLTPLIPVGNDVVSQENQPTNSTVTTSNSKSKCEPRREPSWEWTEYRNQGNRNSEKRLLVAQYSSYGNYARLLELTAPVNKAYARKWNQDFVIVQGSTLIVDSDGKCEPPPHRAMYDKLEILQTALENTNKYDMLLLMDADAMVVDLSFDFTTLVDDDDMLAAHRVSQRDPEPRTYNINNGIVLWNLHHPETRKVSDEWYTTTRKAVIGGHPHGDQHYLQSALKREDRPKYVKGLATEFFYGKGTRAKHFIRTHANNVWNNTRIDDREVVIERVTGEVCAEFPVDCENLDSTQYVR